MTTETPERKIWIDIAKGLGIIAVVLGHSEVGNPSRYIFWFHMPLFFVLSGYLFKPCTNWNEFKQLLRKDTRQLLLPYGSFLILVTLCRYAWVYFTASAGSIDFSADLTNFILGGRFLKGWYAPFWFVTCLYATKIALAGIFLLFSSTWLRLTFVVLAYLLAHLEAQTSFMQQAYIPWNIDVVLISISYFAFGFFARSLLKELNAKILSISLGLTVMIFGCQYWGLINYNLDLKYLGYNHLILDLVVPLTITIAICQLSHLAELTPLPGLGILGQRTLSIMYLHIPINRMLQEIIGYGFIGFTVAGVIIPFLITKYLLERFPTSRSIFLGHKPQKPAFNDYVYNSRAPGA